MKLLWSQVKFNIRFLCSSRNRRYASCFSSTITQPSKIRIRHNTTFIRTDMPKLHLNRLATSLAASAESSTEVEVPTISALKRKLVDVSIQVNHARDLMLIPQCREKLAALEEEVSAGGLWESSNGSKAAAMMTEIERLRSEIEDEESMTGILGDTEFALELLESKDALTAAEATTVLTEALANLSMLEQRLSRWELSRLLTGPYDQHNARLAITAGVGGADAMDWAEMVERMYIRWGEAQGYRVRTVARQVGEEMGIKSSELEIEGRMVYGYLKGEKGTHRLVRKVKELRQTSFAGVEVVPVIEGITPDQLEIQDKDLELQFMRSTGSGGQNVNKVESAVRIIHKPTGLSVRCDEERTQVQNRKKALALLTAKLLIVLEEQHAKKVAEISGDAVKAEWGQQIRNYVLHPYRLVKDTRTGWETSNVEAFLNGDLNAAMEAYLRMKGREETERKTEAA